MIVDEIKGVTVSPIKSTLRGSDLNSLDEEFVQALSDKMSVMHQMKKEMNQLAQNADQISDPATLLKVQAMLADYSLNVDLTSKIAQRILSGIDSLVKS